MAKLHFQDGKVLAARTIMTSEAECLFQFQPSQSSTWKQYRQAIVSENCLAKRTVLARKVSAAYLKNLYILDCSDPIFGVFRYLWDKGSSHRLLLAQLAYLNDIFFRESASMILSQPFGKEISTESTQKWFETVYSNHFSELTSRAIAQRLNSSWYQAGFIQGTKRRVRVENSPGIGNVVFALYLSYMDGRRGIRLFDNEFTRFLDMSPIRLLPIVKTAARQRLLVFHKLGDVIDLHFPLFQKKGALL